MKQYFFISGLPRTGSTLLSSILYQNPLFHTEGLSAVCQLMWDMQESCTKTASDAILGNNRIHTQTDLISEIPNIYYKNIDRPIVFDKCRSWTAPDNVEMIKKYITRHPKIIVLVRPVDEVFKSFGNLKPEVLEDYLTSLEPINRSFYCALNAKQNNNGEFLFVNYDDLVNDTRQTLQNIYKFCELEWFEHDLKNIVNKNPENDTFHGIKGLHDIRPTVSKRKIDFVLPDNIAKRCDEMNKEFFE